jgi:Tol biopolymer transport system component
MSLSAVAALAWLRWQHSVPDVGTIESSIGMEATGGIGWMTGPPALSPDGMTLAFAADDKNGSRMLWVRRLDGSLPRLLPTTELASSPFWSPDGKFIAFLAAGKLKKIPSSGGDSEVIAGIDMLGGGTWNRDGVILCRRGFSSSIVRIIPGGEPADVLHPQSLGARELMGPWFLPDDNHFLVFARANAGTTAKTKQQPSGIWQASLDGKEPPRFLTASDSHGIYVDPGWLLFARDGVLRAQRFDPGTLRLTGDSNAIGPVQSVSTLNYAIFTASGQGALVYQKPGNVQLSELQLRTRSGEIVKELGQGYFFSPELSDDGRRVAVDLSDDRGQGDIWIIDVQSGSQSRLTFDPVNETSPVWSPDNETIAYQGPAAPQGDIGIIAKRPGGVAATLLDLPGSSESPTDWSPDGRMIAFQRWGDRPDGDVLVLSITARTTIDVAVTPAEESAAVFSPDSRWIAYQSDESGRHEVYVQPFPPTGAKYQVSTAGGRWPRWRIADTIEYVDSDGRFSAVNVDATNGLSIEPPRTFPLIIGHRGYLAWSNLDVGNDGSVLVNSIIRDNPPPLTLVVNWERRLE